MFVTNNNRRVHHKLQQFKQQSSLTRNNKQLAYNLHFQHDNHNHNL